MQRRRFIGFLTSAHAGRPQASHARICLTVVWSGMACMLSSHSSLSQDRVPQGKEGASDQQVFNNACRTCHTLKEGDNRQGPNLHSIIGRKAGSLPDYNYSSAMKEAGFVWDKDKLEHFIKSPDQVVPGHKMTPYGGLASADDRSKVIAFLQSGSTDRR